MGFIYLKDKEAAVFLDVGRKFYEPGTAAEHATNDDWVPTRIAADAAIGANTIELPSVTPTSYNGVTFTIAKDDYIGIETDRQLEWFQVQSVSSPNVVINGTLANASATNKRVFIYRTKAEKPLKIYQENVRLWQDDTYELPIYLFAWSEYNLLPNKGTQGLPVQIFYQPLISSTRIAVWPTTDRVSNVLLYRYQAPLEIFSTAADTQDFPAEWIRPLSWALASEAGPTFGINPQRQAQIDARAASLKDEVTDWDQTNASLFIEPRFFGMPGDSQ